MSQDDDSQDIKVILVGEPGTGKTSLINVAIGQQFSQDTSSTLISTFVQKRMIKGKQEYILNIWDTAGQEKYRSITKLFLQGANIIILVYSIIEKESFDNLDYWYKTIKDSFNNETVLAIVGNKYDLFLEEAVQEEEARKYAEDKNAIFKLVSAKTDQPGIDLLFTMVLEEYIEKIKNGKNNKNNDSIIISDDRKKNEKSNKKNCC